MKWQSWVSRAGQRWNAKFPRCRLPECRPQGRLWRRNPFSSGIWLQEEWYCGGRCFEKAIEERFVEARAPFRPPPPTRHRIPLGLLMLSRGHLTHSQLRAALDAQRAHGQGRLGHWIEELGLATEAQITSALGLQWACPVLPRFQSDARCAAALPFHLQQEFRMLPVQFVQPTRVLHVAFSENIEYAALYAIEQILRCRTEPCLLGRHLMDRALEDTKREQRGGEVFFDGWREISEMARITSSYALKLEACHARLAPCGQYVWVRLESSRDTSNLLFQRRNSSPAGGAAAAKPQARKRTDSDPGTFEVGGGQSGAR